MNAHEHTDNYGFVFDGYVSIAASGGYTFSVIARDGGLIEVDKKVVVTSPVPWPQVCDSIGNAVQLTNGGIGLKAGLHHLHVVMTQKTGEGAFAVQWQGPGISLSPISSEMLFHRANNPATP